MEINVDNGDLSPCIRSSCTTVCKRIRMEIVVKTNRSTYTYLFSENNLKLAFFFIIRIHGDLRFDDDAEDFNIHTYAYYRPVGPTCFSATGCRIL